MSASVTGSDLIGSGKWLRLKNVFYKDETGRERVWETLERTTHGRAAVDAVEIVPLLKRKGKQTELIVIKQFRPPTGKYIIELPAGLVDEKEEPTTAALRELREETGYTGKVVDEGSEIIFGMAISNTTCQIVTVEIDGDDSINQNPKQQLEYGEFAEVLFIPIHKTLEVLSEYKEKGFGIDGKIWMLGYGLQMLGRLSEPKL